MYLAHFPETFTLIIIYVFSFYFRVGSLQHNKNHERCIYTLNGPKVGAVRFFESSSHCFFLSVSVHYSERVKQTETKMHLLKAETWWSG